MPLDLQTVIPTPTSEQHAEEVQQQFSGRVEQETGWKLVTGTSVAYGKSGVAYAVAVSLSTSNWRPVEVQRWKGEPPMRHHEGLTGFREGPVMLNALLKLRHTPDVIFVDGHGQAHPRKFGPACHVGVALGHPTVGVGKYYPGQLGSERATFGQSKRGNKTAIMLSHLKVGYQIITQEREPPLFVSVGNRVGLEEAVMLTYKATPVYRLPEPIRQAQDEANSFLAADAADSADKRR